MSEKRPFVINLFAGAGAGKTTAAWGLCYNLKLMGFNVEYVNEICKDLIWEGKTELLDGTFDNQCNLIDIQNEKLRRLVGSVDIIVTDSPLLLYAAYAQENKQAVEDKALSEFNEYNNYNIFIKRNESIPFEQVGRIHNLEQSKEKDGQIRALLDENNLSYKEYTATEVEFMSAEIQQHINRYNLAASIESFLSENYSPPFGYSDIPGQENAERWTDSFLKDIENNAGALTLEALEAPLTETEGLPTLSDEAKEYCNELIERLQKYTYFRKNYREAVNENEGAVNSYVAEIGWCDIVTKIDSGKTTVIASGNEPSNKDYRGIIVGKIEYNNKNDFMLYADGADLIRDYSSALDSGERAAVTLYDSDQKETIKEKIVHANRDAAGLLTPDEPFKTFYDYEYKDARNFADATEWKIAALTENDGFNGSGYIVYKNTDSLPKQFKSMVIKAEERNATKPETAKKKSLDDIVKSATERAKDANDNLISKSAQKDHTTEI